MSQTVPGYTCPICGMYVTTASLHTHYAPSLPDQTDRLIAAIERLIAKLDKLAPPTPATAGKEDTP